MYSRTWLSIPALIFRDSVVANEPCLCHLDFFASRLVNAKTLTISRQLDANTISLTSGGVKNRHIGLMNWHGLFDDATNRTLERIWLGMLLDYIDTFNEYIRIIFAQSNFAALTLVAPGEHDDIVAFANLVHGASLQNFRSQRHDLHELLSAQFTRHWSKDTGANWL